MSKKFAAADDIKKLGKYLQGLIEFASDIEGLGSLEQAEKEAKKAVEVAQAQKLEADRDLDIAKSYVEESKKEAAKIVAGALEKGDKIIAEAAASSEEKLAAVEKQCASFMAQAKGEQKAIMDHIKILKAECESLESEKVDKVAALTQVKEQLASLKKALGA